MNLSSLIKSLFCGGSPSTSPSLTTTSETTNTSESAPSEPCTSCDRKGPTSPCTNTSGCVMENQDQQEQKAIPPDEVVEEAAIPDPVPSPPPALEQPEEEGWVYKVSQWLKYERRYRIGSHNKTTMVIGLDRTCDDLVVMEFEHMRVSMTREQAKRLSRKLADPEL